MTSPTFPELLARCSVGARYCSGIFVASDTVLTCAHFLRPEDEANPGTITVRVAGARYRARGVRRFVGTDIALLRVDAARVGPFPKLGPPPRPLARTVTFGFGGGAKAPAVRTGRFLFTLPLAFSRNLRTFVRPAGVVANAQPAVKGDSGGPVLVDAHLVGTQSLILDPFRTNLRLATISLLTEEVREAIS